MSRIDEMLDSVQFDDYSEPLGENETKHILSMINKKTKPRIRKRKVLKTALIAACVASVLTSVTALAVYCICLDKNLTDMLSVITNTEQEWLQPAIDEPVCAVTENGITIRVLQTLSDGRNVYAVFEVEMPDGTGEYEDFFFSRESFMPEDWEQYTPFSSDIDLLERSGNVCKFLSVIDGLSQSLTDCNLTLTLRDFCGKSDAEEHSIVKGEWTLKWKYDSSVKTDIKEVSPVNTRISAYSEEKGNQTALINKITISPLSMAVDYTVENPTNDFARILNARFELILMDRTVISPQDNADHSYNVGLSADEAQGHFTCRFRRVIDVNDVFAVSINDTIIPIE